MGEGERQGQVITAEQKLRAVRRDGGFPFGWCEINIKPSFRGKDTQEKRRRYHLCGTCTMARLAGINNDINQTANRRP
jgi:hypothetical protein